MFRVGSVQEGDLQEDTLGPLEATACQPLLHGGDTPRGIGLCIFSARISDPNQQGLVCWNGLVNAGEVDIGVKDEVGVIIQER